VERLAVHAREVHAALSAVHEELEVRYEPRIEGWDGERAARAPVEEVAAALREELTARRTRDIGAGQTLTGPHRDDLSLLVNGLAAASFASRGQQRTAALALRLAEARLMAERTDDLPVVLLDDVLSELDQILVTSADMGRLGEGLPEATVFRVTAGRVELV
jgi:DNA replication and repair protein RecF